MSRFVVAPVVSTSLALLALCCLPSVTFAQQAAAPAKPAPTAATAPKPAEETHPPIYALAFSPDGKRLAIGCHRQAVLFDTATWMLDRTITSSGIQNAVRSLTYLPDGKRLAIGSGLNGASGNVMIWDPAMPEKGLNYTPAGDTIEAIAFSQSGNQMLTASFDSKAHLFPWTPYQYGETKLEEHNGRVTAVAFSSKPNYIFITGAMDKYVKVWDYRTTKVVVNFDQAQAGITGLGFLPNGDQFLGSSLDGRLYWWGVSYNERKRIYSGYAIRTVKAHEDGITAFSLSGNHQRVATGGSDHRVCVWNTENGSNMREIKDVEGQIYCTALSADAKLVAAAGRTGLVYVWDVETGKLVTTIIPPRNQPQLAVPAKSIKPAVTIAGPVAPGVTKTGQPAPNAAVIKAGTKKP